MLTSCPERDSQRLGIIPLKRGWRGLGSLARAAHQADLVICGGGGLFQDDDSLLKMPYWAVRLAFLRLLAKRIAGFSIGAGPLRHPVSRLFGRLALQTLEPISVRDPLALAVLQPLTQKTVEVVPDPAFLLQPAGQSAARQLLLEAGVPSDKRLVGVSVRRWFHTNSNFIPHKHVTRLGLHRNRGKPMMSAFTKYIATALDDVADHLDAHIVFMPTYNVQHENDASVCEAIAERMRSDSFSMLSVDDPKLYKAITGLLSVMLCGRMHPAILAAGQGTPIVGLAYNQKSFGMFSLLGQGARCISMADLVRHEETARLVAMLREAIHQPARFKPDTSALEHQTEKFIEKLVARSSGVPATDAQPQSQHN